MNHHYIKFSFALLVIKSNILAWPVTQIINCIWLHSFAYKVSLSWVAFVLAFLTAFALALIMVSIQTLRTAFKRPVDILNYE